MLELDAKLFRSGYPPRHGGPVTWPRPVLPARGHVVQQRSDGLVVRLGVVRGPQSSCCRSLHFRCGAAGRTGASAAGWFRSAGDLGCCCNFYPLFVLLASSKSSLQYHLTYSGRLAAEE